MTKEINLTYIACIFMTSDKIEHKVKRDEHSPITVLRTDCSLNAAATRQCEADVNRCNAELLIGE